MPGGSGTPALDPTAAGILDGARDCIARVGLRKTTLDDVARRAACSRATVYRRFPGKGPLLAALVARDTEALTTDMIERAGASADLDDALVALVTTAARRVEAHDAVQFLLVHEPEALLPYLTLDGADGVLAYAADVGEAALVRFLPAERARRVGEWLARLVLSYLATPAPDVVLTDEESVRALTTFVAPTRPGEPALVGSGHPTIRVRTP